MGSFWTSKKRLNNKNSVDSLTYDSFTLSQSISCCSTTIADIPFWELTSKYKRFLIGPLHWVFPSIVALQNRRGGKELIEHMNDNANSQPVERMNFLTHKYRSFYVFSLWFITFTLQGKAVDGGNLCGEKFFFVLYSRHSWWYKPRYHHWTRSWETDRGMLVISRNCCGQKAWLCSKHEKVQILYTYF